jgi:hypothetical protein
MTRFANYNGFVCQNFRCMASDLLEDAMEYNIASQMWSVGYGDMMTEKEMLSYLKMKAFW